MDTRGEEITAAIGKGRLGGWEKWAGWASTNSNAWYCKNANASLCYLLVNLHYFFLAVCTEVRLTSTVDLFPCVLFYIALVLFFSTVAALRMCDKWLSTVRPNKSNGSKQRTREQIQHCASCIFEEFSSRLVIRLSCAVRHVGHKLPLTRRKTY